MQRCTTHQLHVVVTLSNDAVGAFAHDGKCFDQKVIKRFAPLKTGTEFSGLATQCVVRQTLNRGFKGVDVRNETLEGLEFLAFTGPQDTIEDSHAEIEPTGGIHEPRGSPKVHMQQ